jgi:hypothetical protein
MVCPNEEPPPPEGEGGSAAHSHIWLDTDVREGCQKASKRL